MWCLHVWQLWVHLFDPVKNVLNQPHERPALPLHYLWKDIQYVQAFCNTHEEKKHSWNKCDICTSGNFEIICLTQLIMHLIKHMDGKPYHCTIYGKNFSKSNHLLIDMNNHSWNKCAACTSGNFDFTCSTQLRKHLITHMDGNTYHCTICGNTFSTSKHLVIHMKKSLLE